MPSVQDKRGTVYIAWDGDRYVYSGYWDALPDADPRHLEQMPDMDSVRDALEWVQERALRVLIRPEHQPHAYFWAGRGPKPWPAGYSEFTTRTWGSGNWAERLAGLRRRGYRCPGS